MAFQTPSFSDFLNKIAPARRFVSTTWMRYRGLSKWLQWVIALAIVALFFFGSYTLTHRGGSQADETTLPTVTLASIGSLTGNGSTVTVVGTVRSVTEAAILAQSSGTVTSVHTRLGGIVFAGSLIAELENASQRAAVLQAEGSYEAALATRSSTSATDVAASARNAYVTAYSTLDTVFENEIDVFFGGPTAYGPALLISAPMYDYGELSQGRAALTDAMEKFQRTLPNVGTSDPLVLLADAITVAENTITFLDKLAVAAHDLESGASASQLTALGTARSAVNTLLGTLLNARDAYRTDTVGATSSADASVKIALGSLRAAQAQLEKTLVRAPIGGTVNFLPIRVGDYVTALTHVATVAQNGTLEIVAYVSEENRARLSVGAEVTVEDLYRATITSIAPALDPLTKQIEVRVALKGTNQLLNGQSVRITFKSEAPAESASQGPLLLPLTALKLTPSARIVFSVGTDERLVAHIVTIGDVHGDYIEITSPLPLDLQIVTDARGFSEGQKVTTTSITP